MLHRSESRELQDLNELVHKVKRSGQIVVLLQDYRSAKKTKQNKNKKQKKPEVLLWSTAISKRFFSHSSPSLLLMLHTTEINTATLKVTERQIERETLKLKKYFCNIIHFILAYSCFSSQYMTIFFIAIIKYKDVYNNNFDFGDKCKILNILNVSPK